MRKNALLLSFVILALSLVSLPASIEAATFTVSKSCGTTPDCFSTIGSAITEATSTAVDTIEIQPGTYAESITLTKTIALKGTEAARTIIQSTNTAITVSSLSSVTISRLTIDSSSVGIQGTNATNLTIENNIFLGRGSGTAISITGTSSGRIINNTFFKNKTAIDNAVDLPIQNNIFSDNTVAATGFTAFSIGNVANNLFNNNGSNGSLSYDQNGPGQTNIPNASHATHDPKFAQPDTSKPNVDLHVQEESDAIGLGSGGVEIGAFGGSGADHIPFPVTITDLVTTLSSTSASVNVIWSANKAHTVTSSVTPGSYNVVYNLTSGPVTTVNVTSPGPPIDTVSKLISGLTSTVSAPGQPVLNMPDYANSVLILSWSFVPEAAGYKVHVLDSVTGNENTIDVGNTLFFIVTGLVNGREYGVSVSAYSKTTYHFKVNVQDNAGNESDFSAESTVELGSAVEGLRSSPTQTAFPDRIVAGPDLPNKGCFIATAAYGYYSAPQVQILRTFRDRCLMTNKPGQAFVEWYYRYGPIGAEFMNAHPWLKPVVRIALLPLIGAAWFITEAALSAKVMVLFLAGLMSSFVIVKRKSLRSGGSH